MSGQQSPFRLRVAVVGIDEVIATILALIFPPVTGTTTILPTVTTTEVLGRIFIYDRNTPNSTKIRQFS